MFDLDWGKLVVIGIVALIVIGPKELPTVMRSLGQWMSKIRRMAAEFQGQFQEALREAELADLKKQAEDITSSVTDLTNFDPMANTQKEMERAFMPEAQKAAEPSADAADLVRPEPAAAADPATPHPPIDVPLPEPSGSVTNDDYAPTEVPPPKQAGSGS